jgi:hypothetical protein
VHAINYSAAPFLLNWRCAHLSPVQDLPVQRALFALGIVISLVGLAWPWISKLPLGRLPGDFLIERPGFRLFVPITTMIVVSLLISLVLMLFRK